MWDITEALPLTWTLDDAKKRLLDSDKKLADKSFDDLSAKEINQLGKSVAGTIVLLVKLAGKGGNTDKIEASDVSSWVFSRFPGGLNGKLQAMAEAVQNNRTSLMGEKNSQVRTLLNDHDQLLKSTQEKVDAVKLSTETNTSELAYGELEKRYSQKFDFGATMTVIVGKIQTNPQISLWDVQKSLTTKEQMNLAEEIFTLMGAQKDNVFAQQILMPWRKFLSNINAVKDIDLEKNYDFNAFLKDFADMDDDGIIENVNGEKKEWSNWDLVSAGLSYFMRDKVATQSQVQSELGLYEQIKDFKTAEEFQKVLTEIGLDSMILNADKIKDPKTAKTTIKRIQNALNMRADLLWSRNISWDAVDALSDSLELNNTEMMSKEVRKAVEKLSNTKDLSPDQKNKIIAELTKKWLEFQTSILGAKNLKPDALAQKFGEAIAQWSADNLSIVGLDLRVLKSFYESERINVKWSAGLTLVASKEWFLPIASLGGEVGFTLFDGSEAGTVAYEEMKRNTTINVWAGEGATLMGVHVITPYTSMDLLWSDAIGTVEKLGFAMRQLTKMAAVTDNNGVIKIDTNKINEKTLDSSVKDAFRIMEQAIKDGQAKFEGDKDKQNAFALTLISRFEKVIQASAIQQNKKLEWLTLAGVKLVFAAGILFAGPVIQNTKVSITENRVKTQEKVRDVSVEQEDETYKNLGLNVDGDILRVSKDNQFTVVDSTGKLVGPDGINIKWKKVFVHTDVSVDNSSTFKKMTITLENLPLWEIQPVAPVVTEEKYEIPPFIKQNSDALAKLLFEARLDRKNKQPTALATAVKNVQESLRAGESTDGTFQVLIAQLLKKYPKKQKQELIKQLSQEWMFSDNKLFMEALNAKTQGSRESHALADGLRDNKTFEKSKQWLDRYLAKPALLSAFAKDLGVSSEQLSPLLKQAVQSIKSSQPVSLPQNGFSVYAQEKWFHGIIQTQKWSEMIGVPQEITGIMKAQILSKLYSWAAVEHIDEPMFITLAFEKDAECFNPVIYSVPPAPNVPPVSSVPPTSVGSKLNVSSNRSEIGAWSNIDMNTYTVGFKVADFNKPPETPPPPPEPEKPVDDPDTTPGARPVSKPSVVTTTPEANANQNSNLDTGGEAQNVGQNTSQSLEGASTSASASNQASLSNTAEMNTNIVTETKVKWGFKK